MAGYRDVRRRGFFEASDIGGRHLYHRPASASVPTSRWTSSTTASGGAPSSSARPRCARRSTGRAGVPSDVDFLATTTCTGRMTPSLDAHLVARLGCRRDVQRVHVGDTGCAAAVVALQQACNHIRAFPGHRALVLAVEICSAAYFLDDRLESAVAHAIFADGAGALALSGGRERARDRGASHPVPLRAPRRDGLRVSGRPAAGGPVQGRATHRQRHDGRDGTHAAGEPGAQARGRAALGAALRRASSTGSGARPARLSTKLRSPRARGVLRDYGNMSSATILFVLESVLQQTAPDPGEWGAMIGLGPGFAAEGALLRW